METIKICCQGANTLPLDSIEEFQGSLKKRTKKDINNIITSIEKYGFSFPFFIWNGTGHNLCLDGHGRIQALCEMRKKGIDLPLFPVCYIEAKDEAEAKQKLLRLNSSYGTMTMDSVLEFMGDLELDSDELCLPNGKQIEFDTNIEISEQDNDMPDEPSDELQKKWNVELGQVWQCGNHRIGCGSSDDKNFVLKVLDGAIPSCVFTDPPYGVSIGDKNKFLNEFQKSGKVVTNIENDTMSTEDLFILLKNIFTITKEICAEDCTYFLTAPQGGDLGLMMMMMKDSGLPIRHVLMWKKNSPTFSMGRLDYDYAHEPILLTWGNKHKKVMKGMFKTSVWEVDKPKKCDLHPTMKPVELYINAYLNNSDDGDVVYEPFSGSGTALLASEKTNRKCRAIELDPKYVSVALERWSIITGNTPTICN